jgi:TPR repeat protein
MNISKFLLDAFLPDPFRELENKIKEGCAKSCVELFKLREKEMWGNSSLKYNKARDWLLQAIKCGNRDAVFLYVKHYDSFHTDECVHLLEGLIQSGDNEASHLLAERLLDYRLKIKDVPRAIELYKGMANSGDKSAALLLAELYFNGTHVKRDFALSLEFLHKSDSESKDVNLLIGQILLAGFTKGDTHTEPNPKNALVHLLKAANSGPDGCATSQYLAADLILKNSTLGSVNEAVNLLTRAHKIGISMASHRLCMLYFDGTLLKQDYHRAYFYAVITTQRTKRNLADETKFNMWSLFGQGDYLEQSAASSQSEKVMTELQGILKKEDVNNINKLVKNYPDYCYYP